MTYLSQMYHRFSANGTGRGGIANIKVDTSANKGSNRAGGNNNTGQTMARRQVSTKAYVL